MVKSARPRRQVIVRVRSFGWNPAKNRHLRAMLFDREAHLAVSASPDTSGVGADPVANIRSRIRTAGVA